MGCFGAASIFISQHIPSKMFTVLRLIDLEVLSATQLEDVQSEMKMSQLLQHSSIAGYLCSFVVGSKLWAIQALMHYGKDSAPIQLFSLLEGTWRDVHVHVHVQCTCVYMLMRDAEGRSKQSLRNNTKQSNTPHPIAGINCGLP